MPCETVGDLVEVEVVGGGGAAGGGGKVIVGGIDLSTA
jgi:hypothetical protein